MEGSGVEETFSGLTTGTSRQAGDHEGHEENWHANLHTHTHIKYKCKDVHLFSMYLYLFLKLYVHADVWFSFHMVYKGMLA